MANPELDITPEELIQSADKIQTLTEEFIKKHNEIYSVAENMLQTRAFAGNASVTFAKQLDGYQNDFIAADKALANYINFIRNYAKKVHDKDEDLARRASALSVGK